MGFNFHANLPGPFSYSRRIGGKRRARGGGGPAAPIGPAVSAEPVAAVVFVLLFVAFMVWLVWVTGTWPFFLGLVVFIVGVLVFFAVQDGRAPH